MVQKIKKEKLLVLSIDRDDDIGQKAGIKGPIIGRGDVLRTANKLGLADPEDTDFNALFEAVRVFDELEKQNNIYDKVEIAVVTGNKDRGVRAGLEIGKQMDFLLKQYSADGAILVTDGSDDEHTIPIIQSKVPIRSIRRLVVKQADELESTYFKVKDFIDESLENPKFASLVFGLPAVILILLGLFGLAGSRYVLLLLGAFLVVKWFKLEKHIVRASEEIRFSLTRRHFGAFFVYVLGGVIGVLGIYRGYVQAQSFLNKSIFELVASFVFPSIFLIWISLVVGWFGMSVYKKKKDIGRILSVPIFLFAVSLVVFGAADIILTPYQSLTSFLLFVVLGSMLILLSIIIDKVAFPNKVKGSRTQK